MKRNSWGLAGFVMAASAMVMAGSAMVMAGSSLRIGVFTPAGVGIIQNPNADGMAKLKFYNDPIDGPSVQAHVHLYDFLPGITYSVVIDTDQGGGDFADIVTTNPAGHGNVMVHFPVAAAPTAATLVIYRDTINDDQYEAGEERAIGVPD